MFFFKIVPKAVLGATWPNLGRFWRPTWVPKASQDEAKKEKKREANKNRFRIGLGSKKGTEGKSRRVSYESGRGRKGRPRLRQDRP